jgi:hypothetical protein
MDDITLPRSFEDTIPAEMMKDGPRRQSSQSRLPILEATRQQQAQNYNSITTGNTTNPESNQEGVPTQHESDTDERDDSHDEEERHHWFGKRMWIAFREWEQNNVELVLENRQSVARDNLGI